MSVLAQDSDDEELDQPGVPLLSEGFWGLFMKTQILESDLRGLFLVRLTGQRPDSLVPLRYLSAHRPPFRLLYL